MKDDLIRKEVGVATEHPSVQHRLVGFSGCRLEVLSVGRTVALVRKTSPSVDYNLKLQAEVVKLTRLRAQGVATRLFNAPEVHRVDVDSTGLAFYEMSFVPSWDLGSHIAKMAPTVVDTIADRLHEIIEAIASVPAHVGDRDAAQGDTEANFITSKLDEGCRSLEAATANHPEVRALVQDIRSRLDALRVPDTRPSPTFCHGDLALDNVLISRDTTSLHVIDPLVNGHESVMWDISKVFQSSLLEWHSIKHGQFVADVTRRQVRLQPSFRLSLFNKRFCRLVAERYDSGRVILYLATTVARAAKYAQTPDQLFAFVVMLNELLDRYSNGRHNLDEPLSSLRG